LGYIKILPPGFSSTAVCVSELEHPLHRLRPGSAGDRCAKMKLRLHTGRLPSMRNWVQTDSRKWNVFCDARTPSPVI